MGGQRDVYRQKLYNAERKAFVNQPYDRERTLEDCRARIHELAKSSNAWRLACNERTRTKVINVDRAPGHTSWANSGRWRIQVARFHTGNDWVLVHEMAHLPTANAFQAHGREFCQLYVAMVREIYGDEQADRLAECIRAEGVPVGRDEAYVKYLRRNIKTVANNPDNFDGVEFVTTDGRTVYVGYADHFTFDRDTICLGERAARMNAANPVTIRLEDVAYFSAKRIVKRKPPREDRWY